MAAVALALASSLAWGVGDFLAGIQSRRRKLIAVLVVTQVAGLVAIAIAVAARGQAPPGGTEWLAWSVGASLCGIGGLAALYKGFATGSMGVVAPISSAAAVIPLTVGLATGERPGAIQLAGVALAIAGVVLASREGPARGTAAGAWFAVAAALGIGLFFVGVAEASVDDALWPIFVSRIVSAALLTLVALATRTHIPTGGRDLAQLAPIGILDMAANLLFALATREGLVSLVGVLGSLYPVVTVILAFYVLHERLHLIQRVGAVGALAGAALISAG